MARSAAALLSVEEAGQAMGVSRATVWRLIRQGALPSVRLRGRRLVPTGAVAAHATARAAGAIPPLHEDHPIFRLAGAGRSGGRPPGARNKHAILAAR
jgi:excisionase family DNA binding protein